MRLLVLRLAMSIKYFLAISWIFKYLWWKISFLQWRKVWLGKWLLIQEKTIKLFLILMYPVFRYRCILYFTRMYSVCAALTHTGLEQIQNFKQLPVPILNFDGWKAVRRVIFVVSSLLMLMVHFLSLCSLSGVYWQGVPSHLVYMYILSGVISFFLTKFWELPGDFLFWQGFLTLGSSSKFVLILLFIFMLFFCAMAYTSRLTFPKILQDLISFILISLVCDKCVPSLYSIKCPWTRQLQLPSS